MPDLAPSIDRLTRAAALVPSCDASPVDDWVVHGLAHGRLHEVFGVKEGDAGCATGSVVAQAVAAQALPVPWLRTEASERIDGPLHATGPAAIGFDVVTLVLGVVPDKRALLRAATDAARCPGLGTLVVEARGRYPRST